jgi:hypothetical protein
VNRHTKETKSFVPNRAEVQSSGKKGEVLDRKMEAVYNRQVKQPENAIWKVKENGCGENKCSHGDTW